MKIHAYNEMYVDDAMQTLAETFSYLPNESQADEFFWRFVNSKIAYQFGRGNLPNKRKVKNVTKSN